MHRCKFFDNNPGDKKVVPFLECVCAYLVTRVLLGNSYNHAIKRLLGGPCYLQHGNEGVASSPRGSLIVKSTAPCQRNEISACCPAVHVLYKREIRELNNRSTTETEHLRPPVSLDKTLSCLIVSENTLLSYSQRKHSRKVKKAGDM